MIRREFIKAFGLSAATIAITPHFVCSANEGVDLMSDAYAGRISRARELMKAAKIDLLFTVPSRNMSYLSGINMGRSERLTALLLPMEGEALVICPAFEEERLRRSSAIGNVATWQESEDPYLLAADLLKKTGASVVGIEPSTDFSTYWKLRESTPKLEYKDAGSIFVALRIQKAPDELDSIRRANSITLEAIAATQALLAEGKTELEILSIVNEEMEKRGGSPAGLVQFGPGSALPHGEPSKRKLERESTVLMDVGCRVDGYTSDITRTIFWGDKASAKFKEVYNTVWKAQQAGFETARAGVECQAVDRAARSVIEKAGYGKFFTHRLGHGLGLDGHEPPYLVEGNSFKLQPGNVVTIEPGIYLPGEFGVRIEDVFLITDKGAEPLSKRVEMV